MQDLTLIQVINWVGQFVFWASLVNLMLPPIEWFDVWPRFQKGYKVFLLLVSHYASLNFRSALWGAYFNAQDKPASKDDIK